MQKVAAAITKKAFKAKPTAIKQIVGKGVVNLVYKVSVGVNDYILRFQKGEKALLVYKKEGWCMSRASKLGVPTTRNVVLGIHDGYSYVFQIFIEGEHGGDSKNKVAIWNALGKYARKINSIPIKKYGEDLMSKREFHKWIDSRFINTDIFEKNKLFSDEKILKLKKRIASIKRWNTKLCLSHGDLTPRNTIIHPSGTIYVVDWGIAGGYAAPHRDIAELYVWSARPEYLNAFIRGYGLSKKKFEEVKHGSETLMLLRLLDSIRWNIETNKKWRKEAYVINNVKKLNKLDL